MPRRSTRNTLETKRYKPETFARRKNLSEKKKQQIRRNSKHKCASCGKGVSSSNSHIDHIEPFAIYGDEEKSNLQCVCKDCHENKTNNTHERSHIHNCRNFPTMRLFLEDGVIKIRNYHSAIHKNPNLDKLRSKLSNELGMEIDEASELWYWDYPAAESMEYVSISCRDNIVKKYKNKYYLLVQPQCVKYFIEIFIDRRTNKFFAPIYTNTFVRITKKGYIDKELTIKNIKSLESLYEYLW